MNPNKVSRLRKRILRPWYYHTRYRYFTSLADFWAHVYYTTGIYSASQKNDRYQNKAVWYLKRIV